MTKADIPGDKTLKNIVNDIFNELITEGDELIADLNTIIRDENFTEEFEFINSFQSFMYSPLERFMEIEPFLTDEFWEKYENFYSWSKESAEFLKLIKAESFQKFISKKSNLNKTDLEEFIYTEENDTFYEKEGIRLIETIDFIHDLNESLINFYYNPSKKHQKNLMQQLNISLSNEEYLKNNLPKYANIPLVLINSEYGQYKETIEKYYEKRFDMKRNSLETMKQLENYIKVKSKNKNITFENFTELLNQARTDEDFRYMIDEFAKDEPYKDFLITIASESLMKKTFIEELPYELMPKIYKKIKKQLSLESSEKINEDLFNRFVNYCKNEKNIGHLFQFTTFSDGVKTSKPDDRMSVNIDTITYAFNNDLDNNINEIFNDKYFLALNFMQRNTPNKIHQVIHYLNLQSMDDFTDLLTTMYKKFGTNISKIQKDYETYTEFFSMKQIMDMIHEEMHTTVIDFDELRGKKHVHFKSDLYNSLNLIEYQFRNFSDQNHEKIIEIFDLNTIEKYADFYSDHIYENLLISISPDTFEQILKQKYKNTDNLSIKDKLKIIPRKSHRENLNTLNTMRKAIELSGNDKLSLSDFCSYFEINSYEMLIKILSEADMQKLLEKGLISKIKKTAEQFNVNETEDRKKLVENKNLIDVILNSNKTNYNYLLNFKEVKTIHHIEKLTNKKIISENISEVVYDNISNLLNFAKIHESQKSKYLYNIITSSYDVKIDKFIENINEELIGLETNKIKYKEFSNLIIDLIQDRDYAQEHIEVLRNIFNNYSKELIDINKTNSSEKYNNPLIKNIIELKEKSNGLLTVKLTNKYIKLKTKKAREELLNKYKNLMEKTLTSEKLPEDDIDLLSELIYLAYRPTGFSIEMIKTNIGGFRRRVNDLTHHLDLINHKKEGYKVEFNIIEDIQTDDFDNELLKTFDQPFFEKNVNNVNKLIKNGFKHNQKYNENLQVLIGEILKYTQDDRVESYFNKYDNHLKNNYEKNRVLDLFEILSIIPNEAIFKATTEEYLQKNCDLNKLEETIDKMLWAKIKGSASNELKQYKKALDYSINLIKTNKSNQLDQVEVPNEFRERFNEIIEIKNPIENLHLLINEKNTLILGKPKKYNYKYIINIAYERILTQINYNLKDLKSEIRKIKSKKSQNSNEIKAVISKNIGSFFAKAGAELCTSNNINMWNEERHFHLNLTYGNQIIGNVMLYFEKERDYLVVRGFNPRKDTIQKYDRTSMATGIINVLKQIAKDNNYKEIFIPEQTGWHELSNREEMAAEVTKIIKKNHKYYEKNFPDQRLVIEDANFHRTDLNSGDSVNKLYLLTRVD